LFLMDLTKIQQSTHGNLGRRIFIGENKVKGRLSWYVFSYIKSYWILLDDDFVAFRLFEDQAKSFQQMLTTSQDQYSNQLRSNILSETYCT